MWLDIGYEESKSVMTCIQALGLILWYGIVPLNLKQDNDDKESSNPIARISVSRE